MTDRAPYDPARDTQFHDLTPSHSTWEAEIAALRAENERLKGRLADTPALVLDALAEIAVQAVNAMSDDAINSVTLARGDDPDLVAERVRAIISAALNKEGE